MELPILNNLEKIYPNKDTGAEAIRKIVKNQNLIEQGINDAELLQGPQGPKGETGATGANGNTPFIGTNGNWWIGEIDTGVSASGAQDLTEVKNQINVLNGNMRRFGIETVPAQNGGDANDIKETGIRFIFNCGNVPSGYSYGMLETFNLDASGFSPSLEGVVVQRFTDWYSGYVFTRAYRQESWSEWNCPDAKIAALHQQLIATQEALIQLTNGTTK